MADEEDVGQNSYISPEEKKTEDDPYPDEIVPLVCCTILSLLVIMIILLLVISSAYSVDGSAAALGTTQPLEYLKVTSSGHRNETHKTDVESSSSPMQLSTTAETSVYRPMPTPSSTAKTTLPKTGMPASTVMPTTVAMTQKSTTWSTENVTSAITKAPTKPTTKTSTMPTTKTKLVTTKPIITTTSTTTTTTTATTTQPTTTSSMSTTTTSTTRLTTSTTTTTAFPGKPSRPGKPPPRRCGVLATIAGRYTLICAFEYLSNDKWPSLHQCTDYVYMRTFNYQKQVHEAEKILYFGPKRKKLEPDDSWNIYYDSSERYWMDLKRADMRYSYFKRQLPHADWYLGMWGQTYIRLLNNLWPTRAIMKGLHDYVRSNMSSRKINSSSFEGFAILNTLIIDSAGWSQANDSVHLNIFRNEKTPILLPGWIFIHTAAIWPYGEVGAHGISNKFITDVINSADIVGLSTHNSSEEPHNIYYAGFQNPALFASPPNPIRGATPYVRGMLDIVSTFPYWKKVLNRSKLCLSVTTAINYADAESYSMDFRIAPTHTMRMTRRNFTAVHPDNGKLEVELRGMKYEWWDRAASHAWVVRPNIPGMVGPLNTFFAYDDAASLAPKMKAVLDAYPDDRCVVFEDLGDDSFAGKFTYNSTTVHFESYDLLKVVSGAMIKKYGGPAFPPQYYTKP